MNPNRLLDVIHTQTEIVKLGLDLGGVMDFVAERAAALTDAAGAVVELAEGDEMVYCAASGIAAPHLGLKLSRAGSLSGRCVQDGRALVCTDTETDPRVDLAACRRIGLRSMIVVPLRHRDQVVGVLKVLGREPAAFGDDERGLLDLLSELIAAAMYHATQQGDLFFRATHDALTELPNRALFYERLRMCMAQARRTATRFAVLNLDMDGLKPINDGHGHRAGDAAIREFAQRVGSITRASDTAARTGGDEFAVIMSRVERREDVVRHQQRLARRIGEPFVFDARPLPLAASIGHAIYPDDGEEIEQLIEHADGAMYRSKRARKAGRALA